MSGGLAVRAAAGERGISRSAQAPLFLGSAEDRGTPRRRPEPQAEDHSLDGYRGLQAPFFSEKARNARGAEGPS
jgi:hypothetical protein